jgi:hypothetical protein
MLKHHLYSSLLLKGYEMKGEKKKLSPASAVESLSTTKAALDAHHATDETP